MRSELSVADEFEGSRILRRTLREHCCHFLAPAMIEHEMDALFDALIKRFAGRIETNFQGGVTLQASTALSMQFRQRASRQQAHFYRPDELLPVIYRNALGRSGIKPAKNFVQVRAAVPYSSCIESCAQPHRAGWRIGQALHEGTEIESGSDRKNRQTMTASQIREHFEHVLAIFTRGEDFCGRDQINHMVANLVALGGGRFRRTDIKTAIHLRRIAGD